MCTSFQPAATTSLSRASILRFRRRSLFRFLQGRYQPPLGHVSIFSLYFRRMPCRGFSRCADFGWPSHKQIRCGRASGKLRDITIVPVLVADRNCCCGIGLALPAERCGEKCPSITGQSTGPAKRAAPSGHFYFRCHGLTRLPSPACP
jgi:hypothetical protein